MNIEIFNELISSAQKSNLVQNCIKELTNYLKNSYRKEGQAMSNETENANVESYREENCLYQVVDKSVDGVYLQNTKNNQVFEEKNIPKELQDRLDNDFILRYTNGNYVFEEELTDDFFNSMVSISEYKQLQEKFAEESDIKNIDLNEKFYVVSRENEFSILRYGENSTITVPNALLPFFIEDETVLKYQNGKFEKII